MVSDTRTESMPVADLAFPASPVSPPASPHISHTDKETIDLDKIDLEKSNEKTPIQGTGSRRRRASVVSFGLPGMVEDDPALAGTVHESFDSDAPDDANDGLSFWQRFVRNWKRSLEPPKAQYLNDAGPDDFPDGGYGWVVVLACFLNYIFGLGIFYGNGVYQREYFYENIFPGVTQFQLSWVAGISSATQFIVGPYAGNLADTWGHRKTSVMGGFFVCVGFVAASFSTQFWHLYLTQGLVYGAGCGFIYFSTILSPSHWFMRKRGLALGIAVAGGGVGGFIIAPLTQGLIDRYGWRWALRLTGLMGGAITVFASSLLRPRFQVQKRETKIFEPAYFKDFRFSMLYFARLPAAFGFFVPFSFLPSYAINAGMTAQQGSLALGLVNAASALGRVVFGWIADKFGIVNSYALCQILSPLAILLIWPFAGTYPILIVFSVVLGFVSGGYVSLFPLVTARCFGLQGLGARTGVLFTSTLPGNLAGASIAGLILDNTATKQPDGSVLFNYLPLILYAGFTQLAGGLVNSVLRFRLADWKVAKRI